MTDAKAKPPGRDRREVARVVAGVVVLVLLLAFVIDNRGSVKVGFVFADHETRLIYVLIVTAVFGALLDRLWLRRHRDR